MQDVKTRKRRTKIAAAWSKEKDVPSASEEKQTAPSAKRDEKFKSEPAAKMQSSRRSSRRTRVKKEEYEQKSFKLSSVASHIPSETTATSALASHHSMKTRGKLQNFSKHISRKSFLDIKASENIKYSSSALRGNKVSTCSNSKRVLVDTGTVKPIQATSLQCKTKSKKETKKRKWHQPTRAKISKEEHNPQQRNTCETAAFTDKDLSVDGLCENSTMEKNVKGNLAVSLKIELL